MVAGVPQGGRISKGARRRQGSKEGFQGGAAGGLSRRPCGHCINEGGVWAGRCLVCFGHYVVGRRGGRWSLPGAPSPRLEIPCGQEEVGPAQCGCVAAVCRCSRIASVVRAVALARRPLPRIHCPCPSPQGGTGEGPGAVGERDATRPPYPRRSRGAPLPPGTCRAARGGCLRAPRPFRVPVPSRLSSVAPEGGGGDRRDRRVAAVRGIRGIRLGLALCEGQRCHALRGNKHRPCQTMKLLNFNVLPFFEKMCRLQLCNAMHIHFAQKGCTCAKARHPATLARSPEALPKTQDAGKGTCSLSGVENLEPRRVAVLTGQVRFRRLPAGPVAPAIRRSAP